MGIVVANPRMGAPGGPVLLGGRDPFDFHRRLAGYRPTPLLDVPDLAAALGVESVLVKVEAERFGLPAFKFLGASWATHLALCERFGLKPGTSSFADLAAAASASSAGSRPLSLIAATDGNHGRAVARMAKLLGLCARIFVPAGTAAARIDGIASEGAEVVVVDGTYADAVGQSAEKADEHHIVISDTSWPAYTATPTHVVQGYSTIFWEIDEALEAAGRPPPDLVFVPAGVGAFAAAAVSHYRRPGRPGSPPVVVSVEPVDAACVLASIKAGEPVEVPGPHRSTMAGLNCGEVSAVAWPVLAEGLAWCVAVDDEQAHEAMRALARIGIVAGESAAASLAGATEFYQEVASDPTVDVPTRDQSTVLLLLTEGATDPVSYRAAVGADPDDVGPPSTEWLVG